MNRRRSRLLLVCGLIALASQLGLAAPVQWEQNCHSYEVIVVGSGGISWPDAQAAAVAKGGHLATLTSLDELEFVFNLTIDTPGAWISYAEWAVGPWLGASDAASEGTWEWVTGEPYEKILHPDYPDPDDPDLNCTHGVNGDYLIFWGCTPRPICNDASGSYHSYVIEYEPPTVEIVGPEVVVVSNPIHSNRKLDITLTATGEPAGGSYQWTVIEGADKIRLQMPKMNTKTVKAWGIDESIEPQDVIVKVAYTYGSQTVYAVQFMTVQKPTLVWEQFGYPKTERQVNRDGEVLDYETIYQFAVYDQLHDPANQIFVKGMRVEESVETIYANYDDIGTPTVEPTDTNNMGVYTDSLLPPQKGNFWHNDPIPEDLIIRATQTIWVEGWNVGKRCLTYHYNEATSEQGDCLE